MRVSDPYKDCVLRATHMETHITERKPSSLFTGVPRCITHTQTERQTRANSFYNRHFFSNYIYIYTFGPKLAWCNLCVFDSSDNRSEFSFADFPFFFFFRPFFSTPIITKRQVIGHYTGKRAAHWTKRLKDFAFFWQQGLLCVDRCNFHTQVERKDIFFLACSAGKRRSQKSYAIRLSYSNKKKRNQIKDGEALTESTTNTKSARSR